MNLRIGLKYCFKDNVSMYWSYECYYQMAISWCQVNSFTARKTYQVVKAEKLFLLIISLLLPFPLPTSAKLFLAALARPEMLSTCNLLNHNGKTPEVTANNARITFGCLAILTQQKEQEWECFIRRHKEYPFLTSLDQFGSRSRYY